MDEAIDRSVVFDVFVTIEKKEEKEEKHVSERERVVIRARALSTAIAVLYGSIPTSTNYYIEHHHRRRRRCRRRPMFSQLVFEVRRREKQAPPVHRSS